MLSEIKLKNFKSYKTEQAIPLKKLNLLFGPNGGGKSSVIQSIMLQKRLLGIEDSYTDTFTKVRSKQTEISSNNDGIREEDLMEFSFTFDEYYYKALDVSEFPFKENLFKSELELSFKYYVLTDYPVEIEIIEKKRYKYSKNTGETVVVKKDELIKKDFDKDFTLCGDSKKLIFKMSNKYSFDDLPNFGSNHENYKLEYVELEHPFFYQNIRPVDLHYLIGSEIWLYNIKLYFDKLNELKINLCIKYKRSETFKFDSLLSFKGVYFDFFKLSQEDSIYSIKKWFDSDDNFCYKKDFEHPDINLLKLAEIVQTDSSMLKLFLGNHVENHHFEIFKNILSPLNLLIDSNNFIDAISQFKNHKTKVYHPQNGSVFSMRSALNIYKHSEVIPPLREVPKRITLNELTNKGKNFSPYVMLFNDLDLDLDDDSLKVVNNYLKTVHKEIELMLIEPIGRKNLNDVYMKKTLIGYFLIANFTFNSQVDHKIKKVIIVLFLITLAEFGAAHKQSIKEFELLKNEISKIKIDQIIESKDELELYFSLHELILSTIDIQLSNIIEFLLEFKIVLEKHNLTEQIPEIIKIIDQEIQEHEKYQSLAINSEIEKYIELNYNDFSEILIFDSKSKILARFNETGTGFSQVFPIIINSALLTNRLLMIEQPELHLHPGLQANLAKMFVKSVNENHNQLILETHSEHLIKAVQLEVAKYHASKGKVGISKEDVSMLYISRNQETGSSEVKEMKLDESGSFIDPWPDDFFDSSSDLTFERLRITHNN